MNMLHITPTNFSVGNGKFSSDKRYLYQSSASASFSVTLPVINTYTIEVQGDGQGAVEGSTEENLNFIYSNGGYIKYSSVDTGFRSSDETFLIER